jgi:archaellum component FlaC
MSEENQDENTFKKELGEFKNELGDFKKELGDFKKDFEDFKNTINSYLIESKFKKLNDEINQLKHDLQKYYVLKKEE